MRFAQGPCREDAEERLEHLMNTYGTQVKRLCCLYLKDMEQAQDAAQETFLKAWRRMDTFRGDCSERTWLARIAVNTCRDYLRSGWFRRLDRRIMPEELPLTAPAPEEPELTEALLRLPDREREVLILRYYEQLAPEDIARMLACPVNTIKSRLARGKQRLKSMLEGWNEDDE